MQLVTRQIVNEAGEVEIWLGDSSRRLTPDELDSLQGAVEKAQYATRWEAAVSRATSLKQIVTWRWSDDEQRHIAYRSERYGMADKEIPIQGIELEEIRRQILSKRASSSGEAAGGSGFVVGGTAP